VQVDVAVVGGGITGVTTALLLAESGKRVALLEARQLGAGVTGHTTAHLTEIVDTRYHELESKLGRETAQLVRASSRAAIEKIAELAGTADCGFERVNGYLFADQESQLAELDAELGAAQRAGAQVERSAVPLALPVRGGLCFPNQAQFHPLAYLDVLTKRLGQSNALIYEGTAMLSYESKGQVRLTTDTGHAVTADALVLATHAPFASLGLQLELAQYRSYVVAGRCASAPRGLFWDLADPYHYVRSASIAGESYLIVGGCDHRTGKPPEPEPGAPFQELASLAGKLGATVAKQWSAQVVESADGLPFIGQIDADPVYVAQGFAGNGMTFGTLSAMLLTDQLLGRKNPFAAPYRTNRFKPRAALGAVVSENMETAGHLVAGHVLPVSHAPIDTLPVGEGRIIKHEGHKLAVYRDQSGAVHAVSAICTHQGCQVAFNAVECSWDCPCHGSRFDVDGRVLDGPAMKPLEKRTL
jgi:glycine/D-amino acid oxidase-like deaminating enzyme/nitrite reductase/ring-hydroxylating ferredoxin subunit